MLVNGVSKSDINSLTPQEAYDLYITLNAGLWGYVKDYQIAYVQNVQLHNLREILVSANSKNYRTKKFDKLEKVYPDISLFIHGREKTDKENGYDSIVNIFKSQGIKI